MSEVTKQADAILLEGTSPGSRIEKYNRGLTLNATFGPVLGCKVVNATNVLGGKSLLTPFGETPQMKFATDHPVKPGQDRYEWSDRGDGILYGTLIKDEDPDA